MTAERLTAERLTAEQIAEYRTYGQRGFALPQSICDALLDAAEENAALRAEVERHRRCEQCGSLYDRANGGGCPCMRKRDSQRIADLEASLAEALADLHDCPVCRRRCKECDCVEKKMFNLEASRDAALASLADTAADLATFNAMRTEVERLNASLAAARAERDAAVREEREACANVAQDFADTTHMRMDRGPYRSGYGQACIEVASNIRSRGTTGGQ